MKSKLLGRSSTYLFAMSALLLALLIQAYVGEMLAMTGLAPTRPGIVAETNTSDPVYSAQDGTSSTHTIYTYEDNQHNTFVTSSLIGGTNPSQGDHVTLGVYDGRLVSVNDGIVDQLNFWERSGFGVMLGLFGIGVAWLAKKCREPSSKDDEKSAWFIALITAMPAVASGGVVLGIGYACEILGVPYWPLALIALTLFISWRVYKRIRNKPPLVVEQQEA